MLKKILAPALGAFALASLAAGALAQVEPQYQPPQPQYQPQYNTQGQQASPACVRLEAQLASLSNPNAADPRQQQIEASYNQQREEVERMTARSRSMGCGRNFLFGPRPPPECRGLQNQIDRMRDSVERLEDQLNRGRGDSGLNEARRRDVVAALAHHRCGSQYEAQIPQQERGGLFGFLFGNRGGYTETYPGAPVEGVPSGTFRTVCVRTCDGFFFPVNFTTVPARFGQDESICKRTCPGTEAMLFSYPNPGGTIEQATSTSGQPYTSLPNAFKYQTEYVKDCSCKPAGKTWEQALSGAGDDTLQRGDIVVDEERARTMSQPTGAQPAAGNVVTPDQAASVAQDGATDAPPEGVIEGPANTELPPGYVPDPNARVAEPYYLPPSQAPPQAAPPPPQQQQRQQRPDPRYLPPQFR